MAPIIPIYCGWSITTVLRKQQSSQQLQHTAATEVFTASLPPVYSSGADLEQQCKSGTEMQIWNSDSSGQLSGTENSGGGTEIVNSDGANCELQRWHRNSDQQQRERRTATARTVTVRMANSGMRTATATNEGYRR